METITRKSLIYRSGLGFYCINHVQGCSHGCLYPCYAYMMARSHGRVKNNSEWCAPKLVSNAEELLLKELARMRTRPSEIHMCLTTDPFMYGHPEVSSLSMKLIEHINSFGIPVSILTKGILPVDLADSHRFTVSNQCGISLVSLDEEFRKRWEPGAAPYRDRINALKELHESGCRTYVHMEPYPAPNFIGQDLNKILSEIRFADSIYFSGWNYNNRIRDFQGFREFYRDQCRIVRQFCSENGIEFSSGISI